MCALSGMCVLPKSQTRCIYNPIMSDIHDIITADFDYIEDNPCKRALSPSRSKILEINSSSLLTPALPLSSPLPLTFASLSLSRSFRVSTRTRLFSLSTLSIVFCIAHPQASVHYRKYWISIMKYWMISDIRRAADIVRSQYVLAFLAVLTSSSRPGRGNCFACGSIFDN